MADSNQTTSSGGSATTSGNTQNTTSGATVTSGGSATNPTSGGSTVSSGGSTNSGSNSTTTSGGSATSGGSSSGSSNQTSGGSTQTPTSGGGTTTSGGSNTSSGNNTSSGGSAANGGSSVSSGGSVTTGVPMADGTPTPAGNTDDTASWKPSYTSDNKVINSISVPGQYVVNGGSVLNTSPDIFEVSTPFVLVPGASTSLSVVIKNNGIINLPIVTSGMTDTAFFAVQGKDTPPQINFSVDPLSGNFRLYVENVDASQSPIKASYNWTAKIDNGQTVTGTVNISVYVEGSLEHPVTKSGRYITVQDENKNDVIVDSSMNATVLNSYVAYTKNNNSTTFFDFVQKVCRYPCNEGLMRLANAVVSIISKSDLKTVQAQFSKDLSIADAGQVNCLLTEFDKVYNQKLPLSRVDAPEILRKTRSQRIVGFIQQQARLNHK